MREEFEELERNIRSDLDYLFSIAKGVRYNGVDECHLEKELDNIEYYRNIMVTISMHLNDYYDDISDELVKRESEHAV